MSNGNRSAPSAVAWAALVVAILAFIFAWAAYNRAGEDLGDQIQQETQEIIDTEGNGPDVIDDEENDTNNDNDQDDSEEES